jgi:hypothetical protein
MIMEIQQLSDDVYVINGMIVATAPSSTKSKSEEQVQAILVAIIEQATSNLKT